MAACLLAQATWCFVGPNTPWVLNKVPSSASSGSIISPASDASMEAPLWAGWNPLACGVALGLLAAVVGNRPALAADLENGEAIFNG
eukprot:CAMPEP_0172851986 /NCGR_PEP_ID=MMETSP1075-20121228/51967_1 /TAXON_ID=2916 /ORGANISM="Ceratium fusus, Strain PA161109" /LENGTH=86 /DNA_ID=CAMNT_0013698091 /DNA_START=30 /DNA_END=287 /DNA_ORIENTATION=+